MAGKRQVALEINKHPEYQQQLPQHLQYHMQVTVLF